MNEKTPIPFISERCFFCIKLLNTADKQKKPPPEPDLRL